MLLNSHKSSLFTLIFLSIFLRSFFFSSEILFSSFLSQYFFSSPSVCVAFALYSASAPLFSSCELKEKINQYSWFATKMERIDIHLIFIGHECETNLAMDHEIGMRITCYCGWPTWDFTRYETENLDSGRNSENSRNQKKGKQWFEWFPVPKVEEDDNRESRALRRIFRLKMWWFSFIADLMLLLSPGLDWFGQMAEPRAN